MFHVLDHADIVYTGDLSQSTRYVLEHYGNALDAAIRAGIRILYSDAQHSLTAQRHATPELWRPIADWKVD